MKIAFKLLAKTLIFVLLSVVTQIGGVLFILSELIVWKWLDKIRFVRLPVFLIIYLLATFLIVPQLAPLFGREKIVHSVKIQPTNYLTVVLNRNYVRPQLNQLLAATEQKLEGSGVTINYLDASFPFIDNFPLLPHLSHNDGKKIDVSLIYETAAGEISEAQKSNSGYGVFEGPTAGEVDQIEQCLQKGYWQYDFPKYLTLGTINQALKLSEQGSRQLIGALLSNASLGKLFIEPHLKQRLKLNDKRVRYHGCQAVRHDDHIHVQL